MRHLRPPSLRWYLNGLLLGLLLFGSCAHAWALADQYSLIDLGAVENPAIAKDDNRVISTDNANGTSLQLLPSRLDLATALGHVVFPLATAAGRIAGQASFGTSTHAFVYNVAAQQLIDLGATLDNQDGFSAASAVTTEDAGGFADNKARDRIVPVLWSGTTPIELPTLGGEDGRVDAMNERGETLGNSLTADGETHCTFWSALSLAFDCHPGPLWVASYGTDLAPNGTYVLNATAGRDNPVFGTRGFLGWSWGQAVLAPLAGDTHSLTNGVTLHAESVGQSCRYPDPKGICRAVAWSPLAPIDLNTRIINPEGWTLVDARGVSEDGWIVAIAEKPGLRETHTVVLVPADNQVVAWYKWRARIIAYYQGRYDRWQKSIAWYYRDQARQARR